MELENFIRQQNEKYFEIYDYIAKNMSYGHRGTILRFNEQTVPCASIIGNHITVSLDSANNANFKLIDSLTIFILLSNRYFITCPIYYTLVPYKNVKSVVLDSWFGVIGSTNVQMNWIGQRVEMK